MLVSRNLLIEFSNNFKNVKENEFINACNKVGIEVEQILKHPNTDNLRIVKILSIKKHPNADKLNLVKIELNDKKIKEIVCGANNLKENFYAIYAPSGTVLYNGLKLEKKKIRGVDSDGMLCALSELTNIGTENFSNQSKNGIIIFENKIKETQIRNFLGLDDVIYDLSIPSNRNDLNSVLCLLSELSLHLNLDYSLPSNFSFPKKNTNIKLKINNSISKDIAFISFNNSDKFNLSISQKEILSSSGYKVNDNLLDVLNFIFILSGNPLHVYDNDFVKNNVSVELSEEVYHFNSLDDKNYDIPKGSIVVKNKNNEIVSLPFLIGSKKSMYNDETKNVLVEIGNFNNLIVRNTMNTLKISTKASLIGNKKISNYNTQLAFKLLINFLNKINICFETNYIFSNLIEKNINVDFDRMSKFIGVEFNKNEIISLMNKTSFIFKNNDCYIHPSRLDIENQYDVFEEVMKIIDINKLDLLPINFNILSFKDNEYEKTLNDINNFLLNNGFMQVKTYNLTSKELAKKFDYLNLFSNICIKNPISNVREYLKSNSIPEMLDVIKYNFSRKHKLFNIYEINKIQTSLTKSNNILNILFINDFLYSNVNKSIVSNDLLNIKSFLKTMFNKYQIDFEIKDNNISIISHNKKVGYIFLIDKSVMDKFDLKDYKNKIYATVINLDILSLKEVSSLNNISPYPFVLRDINFTLPKRSNEIKFIMNEIEKIKNVVSVELTDYFEKDDKIVYTLSITISNLEKTLNTDEINEIMSIIEKIKY